MGNPRYLAFAALAAGRITGRSTDAILAILRRYRVPATFFNIGAAMASRPALVREEVTDGYAMGNHTWNHLSLVTLTAARQAAELSQASAEQQAIAGTVPCAFRPPYGNYDATTLTLAQQRRMTAWLWSTDTLDWMADGSGAASWVHRIVQLAEQGGALPHPILLMHDQRKGNPPGVGQAAEFREQMHPLVPQHGEARSWFYLLRVAAFLLIAAAIVRKNAGEPDED